MTVTTEVRANYAIVIRGDILAVREIARQFDLIIADHPEVRTVHRQTSASKLWIKEGEEQR